MYMAVLDMGPIEFAVLQAIKILSDRQDAFTQEDIARVACCHPVTVSRACIKLQAAGRLEKSGAPRSGYNWQVIDNANP